MANKILEADLDAPVPTPTLALNNSEKDKFLLQPNSYRQEYGKYERRRIWKNLIGLGFVFVLIFTAFMCTSNLQSTLHAKVSHIIFYISLIRIQELGNFG